MSKRTDWYLEGWSLGKVTRLEAYNDGYGYKAQMIGTKVTVLVDTIENKMAETQLYVPNGHPIPRLDDMISVTAVVTPAADEEE